MWLENTSAVHRNTTLPFHHSAGVANDENVHYKSFEHHQSEQGNGQHRQGDCHMGQQESGSFVDVLIVIEKLWLGGVVGLIVAGKYWVRGLLSLWVAVLVVEVLGLKCCGWLGYGWEDCWLVGSLKLISLLSRFFSCWAGGKKIGWLSSGREG